MLPTFSDFKHYFTILNKFERLVFGIFAALWKLMDVLLHKVTDQSHTMPLTDMVLPTLGGSTVLALLDPLYVMAL